MLLIVSCSYTYHILSLYLLQVMLHLVHPKDVIAVQVLISFEFYFILDMILLRMKLVKTFREFFKMNFLINQLTKHCNTKFFIRINELLESVISSIGQPLSRYR